ncbi:hypothetical protein GCK32_008251 [Trichostrongylus colubriformis]|uniref:Uncharacterized protein n=1 Tax=Trichostrongylus colubriformis TaxID=6319 RepID=A0AAN8ILE4_TRICO
MGKRNLGVDTTTAPAEPSPELERIRRQIRETEKELNAAREATLKANRSIEKEREGNQGRASSSKTMDRLKDWRRSCQARESRLEREMRDLETRLEREIRRQDRRSRSHSQERQRMRRQSSGSPQQNIRQEEERERKDKHERRRSSAASKDRV